MAKHEKEFNELEFAFNSLKDYLMSTFPNETGIAANGTEITRRCHFCGDSRDPNKRHLYIGINSDNLICYNCFKCNNNGIVDGNFLRDMGVDYNIIDIVVEANSKARKKDLNVISSNSKRNFYSTPIFILADDNMSKRKLSYLNNRLGTNISSNDANKYKIIFNLKEFLNKNKVKYYSRKPNIIEELNIGFMGFLSIDNSHIIMRRLVHENKVNSSLKERYNIYNIYSEYDGGNTYYVIPGMVDRTKHINICISEGPFDIISVKENLPQYQNSIYAAACGKSNYIGLLNYLFFTIKIPILDCEIHLFSDNDVSDNDIKKIINYSENIFIPISIHMNQKENEKDYGVVKERISDSIVYKTN